jgi:hypothetical protein
MDDAPFGGFLQFYGLMLIWKAELAKMWEPGLPAMAVCQV